MIYMINSYQHKLRECAANVETRDLGVALLLRDAAAELDEKDRIITKLLYSAESGSTDKFNESLMELAILINFDRRKI